MEKRKVIRNPLQGIQYAITANFIDGSNIYQTEILNMHFKGACFKLLKPVDPETIQSSQLQFKLGQKSLNDNIMFKVCWYDSSNLTIGVEFENSINETFERKERFNTHSKIKPYLTSKDPLDPNRELICFIENVSSQGILLSTSLTNKHMFPGMKLPNSTIIFSNSKQSKVNLIIQNCRVSQDQELLLGCEVNSYCESYLDNISEHLLLFGEKELNKVSAINKNIKKNRKIKHGLSFKTISTDTDYDEVCKLRFIAYSNSKKSLPTDTYKNFGSGLNQEGMIIGGYLSGQLLCSVELRFPIEGHELFCLKNSEVKEVPGAPLHACMEINRLVVHPDLQSTDLLIGLFQKIHSVCVAKRLQFGILSATEKLKGLYKKIGAIDTGLTFSHPRLENEILNILVLPPEIYNQGKSLNPYLWEQIYGTVNGYFAESGIISKNNWSLWNRIHRKISEFAFTHSKGSTSSRKTKINSKQPVHIEKDIGHVNAKWTEQHMNSAVIYPYILVAEEKIGTIEVHKILTSLEMTKEYLQDKSNWISVSFLDSFLNECEKYLSIDELSISAAQFSMRKEILGINYHILKHFASPKLACQSISKIATRLNQTRMCEYVDMPGNRLRLKIGVNSHINLPKHKSSCLNWQKTLEESLTLVNGKPGKVVKLSCCYNGDDACTYELSWNQNKKIIDYLAQFIILSIAPTLNYFLLREKTGTLTALYISSLILFAEIFFLIFSKFLNLKKEKNWDHNEFHDYQVKNEKRYSELQQSKKMVSRKYMEAQLISNISERIQKESDFKSICDLALESICKNYNFDRALLMLKDTSGKTLECRNTYGQSDNLSDIYNFRVDISAKREQSFVMSSVYHTGNSIILNNISEHLFQLNNTSRLLIDRLQVKKFIMVAIPGLNGTWGVLAADRKSDEEITINDLNLLERICTQLGISLDAQAKLEREMNLRKTFEKFVPNRFANDNFLNGQLTLGGQVKNVACMFLDLREFTHKSQKMPAAKTLEFLNIIFQQFEKSITQNQGVIDKFLGDGLMATWIADKNDNIDFTLPYKTACHILTELDSLNTFLNDNGWPEIDLGIGLSSGDAIVGNIGSESRMEFTCIGRPINLASRLESLCKKYQSNLVLSINFLPFIQNIDHYQIDKNVTIRGFTEPMDVIYLVSANKKIKGIVA